MRKGGQRDREVSENGRTSTSYDKGGEACGSGSQVWHHFDYGGREGDEYGVKLGAVDVVNTDNWGCFDVAAVYRLSLKSAFTFLVRCVHPASN